MRMDRRLAMVAAGVASTASWLVMVAA